MAWAGQASIAMAKFWEERLVEEITLAILLMISKWAESIRTHLPQPRQRLTKTLSFWKLVGVVVWSVELIVLELSEFWIGTDDNDKSFLIWNKTKAEEDTNKIGKIILNLFLLFIEWIILIKAENKLKTLRKFGGL